MSNEIIFKKAQFGHIAVSSILDFYLLRTNKKFIYAISKSTETYDLSISFSFSQNKIHFQVGPAGYHKIDIQDDSSIVPLNVIQKAIEQENFHKTETNTEIDQRTIDETKEITQLIVSQFKKIFQKTPEVSENIETILLPVNDNMFFIGFGDVHDILALKTPF